ncbi:Gti1/Pac2 family-domain-containing protein [Russula compacta]|nr:Gti1/Pac2 family-domain-containing protein [Russula compacta]
MQRPTCTDIRVRSVSDALVIFYAVSIGVLPIVSRRLDSEERRCIRSGSVYVWEERGPDAEATGLGIERWTDGIRWGPSRVRDEFLFYSERELDMEPDVIGQHFSLHLPPGSYYGRPRERLIKQTYSVYVDLAGRGRRKWHLIAYFTQETIDNLYTIDDFPELVSLQVPPGKFRSARCNAGPYSSHQSRSPKYAPYPASTVQPPSPLDPPAWPKAAHDLGHGKLGHGRFSSTPDGAQVLAPLAFLETTHIPKRHPIDDRALRSFSVSPPPGYFSVCCDSMRRSSFLNHPSHAVHEARLHPLHALSFYTSSFGEARVASMYNKPPLWVRIVAMPTPFSTVSIVRCCGFVDLRR